jgi:hypothetical protein
MKLSHTTTLSRPPASPDEETATRELLGIIKLVFEARIGIDNPEPFNDTGRVVFRLKVSQATRMVAFISFRQKHPFVEITFYKARMILGIMYYKYDYDQQEVVHVPDPSTIC